MCFIVCPIDGILWSKNFPFSLFKVKNTSLQVSKRKEAMATCKEQTRKISISWSIKGYHIFKRRPSPNILMYLEADKDNEKDPWAINVLMPGIEKIPENFHNEVTRNADERRRTPQLVKDIAGKQIGRVPANLCKAFSSIMGEDLLKEDIRCQYKGSTHPTTRPPSKRKYQRAFGASTHDIEGGGAAMECTYFFTVKNSAAEERVMKIFKDSLPQDEMQRIKCEEESSK